MAAGEQVTRRICSFPHRLCAASALLVAQARFMAPPNLRELPQSERHFWQHSITDQLSLKVFDQNADYFRRVLPENEVAVLALNEIAAERRRGYFLHLPSRSAWASLSDEDRTPAERSPLLPG